MTTLSVEMHAHGPIFDITEGQQSCYYREAMFIQMHLQHQVWISTSATRSIFAVFSNVPFFIVFRVPSPRLVFSLLTFVFKACTIRRQMPARWRPAFARKTI